ncbi:hypothetical protein [Clostridium sp. DL1XJH146]
MDRILYKDRMIKYNKHISYIFIPCEILCIYGCIKNIILGIYDWNTVYYFTMLVFINFIILPKYRRVRKNKYIDYVAIYDDRVQIRHYILCKKCEMIYYKDIKDIFTDKEHVIIKFLEDEGKEKEFRIQFYFIDDKDKLPLIEYFSTIKNNLKFFSNKGNSI